MVFFVNIGRRDIRTTFRVGIVLDHHENSVKRVLIAVWKEAGGTMRPLDEETETNKVKAID